jgi:hypothetical protein
MNIVIMTPVDHPPNATFKPGIEQKFMGHITTDENAQVTYRYLVYSLVVYDHGEGGTFEVDLEKEAKLTMDTINLLAGGKKGVITVVDKERHYLWTSNPQIVEAARRIARKRMSDASTSGVNKEMIVFTELRWTI